MAAGVRGRALWVALAAAGCKVSNPLFIDSGGSDASSVGPMTDSASETTTAPDTTSTTGTTETTAPGDTSTTSEDSGDTTLGADTTTATTAEPELCGNGKDDPGEDCDDGNLEPGDGCEPNCRDLFAMTPISDVAPISAIAAGDLDTSGLPDLALAQDAPAGVELLANDEQGGFTALMAIQTDDPVLGVAAGAIDGVEGSDLALAFDEEFRVFVQQADGAFVLQDEITVTGDPSSLTLARGDADEKLDMLFTKADVNQVEMRLGLGDGKLGDVELAALHGAAKHLAVGDLGDGPEPDLVVTYSAEGTGVLEFCPDFVCPKEALVVKFGESAAGVVIAELTPDFPGPEIVVADPADGRVWLLRRPDAASMYAPLVGATIDQGQPTEVLALALHGGSELDVVALDGGSGDVHVITATPQGFGETVVTFAAVGNPAGWAAADFNGDDRVDLAVASKTEGVVLLTNLSAE